MTALGRVVLAALVMGCGSKPTTTAPKEQEPWLGSWHMTTANGVALPANGLAHPAKHAAPRLAH